MGSGYKAIPGGAPPSSSIFQTADPHEPISRGVDELERDQLFGDEEMKVMVG